MDLFEISTVAHLGGSAVLALFFFLLERHDPRPYVRDWMAAWIAQAVALGALLLVFREEWQFGLSLYLFLETGHGLLLWVAARSYAGAPRWRYTPARLLAPLVLWTAAAPPFFTEPRALVAAQYVVLALCHVMAAIALWPARRTEGMGARLTGNVFVILAALYLVQALLLHLYLQGERPPVAIMEAVPFKVLLLQMLLAFGMVLSITEAAERALRDTNAQLEQAQKRLRLLAETDPLTGCYNRLVFRELVDELRAGRGADHGAVLLLDMDGLKPINDRLGHAAGDEAIRQVADAIRARTRITDLLVRWGGDEFVVVLPGTSPAEAEARRAQIVESVRAAGQSASVGLATYGPGLDMMIAVEDADRRMYAAKAATRAGRRAVNPA